MRCKIFRNKRSVVIDEALPLIGLIIVAVLFVGWTKVSEASDHSKISEDIQKQKDAIYAHEEMTAYLKKLDENGNNRIDFLSKSYNERNLNAIRNDLELYFRPKFSNLQMWRIELYDQSGNGIITPPLRISDKNFPDTQLRINQVASITVPINSLDSKFLTFKVYFGRLPQ